MGYHVPTRAKLKMQVLRGYPGNSAANLSRVAMAKDGEGILSGMIVQLDSDGLVVKGIQDQAKPVYVAYHDQTDGDAKEAGMQLFDVNGNYEFQTGYFAEAAYPEGTPLTATAAGIVTPVTDSAAQTIIGFASREEAGDCVKNLEGQNSGAVSLDVLTFVADWKPVVSIP